MCVLSLCLPLLWWLQCSVCCVVLCTPAVRSSVCPTQTRLEWRVCWQRECRPGLAGSWCLAPSGRADWLQRGFAAVSWGPPRPEASGSFSPSAQMHFSRIALDAQIIICYHLNHKHIYLTLTTDIKETMLLLVNKSRSHNNHCGILSHKYNTIILPGGVVSCLHALFYSTQSMKQ